MYKFNNGILSNDEFHGSALSEITYLSLKKKCKWFLFNLTSRLINPIKLYNISLFVPKIINWQCSSGDWKVDAQLRMNNNIRTGTYLVVFSRLLMSMMPTIYFHKATVIYYQAHNIFSQSICNIHSSLNQKAYTTYCVMFMNHLRHTRLSFCLTLSSLSYWYVTSLKKIHLWYLLPSLLFLVSANATYSWYHRLRYKITGPKIWYEDFLATLSKRIRTHCNTGATNQWTTTLQPRAQNTGAIYGY